VRNCPPAAALRGCSKGENRCPTRIRATSSRSLAAVARSSLQSWPESVRRARRRAEPAQKAPDRRRWKILPHDPPRRPSGEPWDRALLRAAGDDSHLLRSERFAAPTNAEEGTESCSYRAARKYASPHIHRANRPKGALRALPAPRS